MRFVLFEAILKKPCEHDSFGRFCSKCGHERAPAKLTFRSLFEEFLVAWLQKGFFQTVIGLFVAPGQQIRLYLQSDRTLLIKPISYLIIIVAFNYLILSLTDEGSSTLLGGTYTAQSTGEDEKAIAEALTWLSKHGFEFSLVQAFIAALLLRLIFYRKRYLSLAELTIFTTYVFTQSLLLKTLFNVAWLPTGGIAPVALVAPLGLAFNIWATASFMGGINLRGVIRATLSQLTAILVTMALLILALVIWDMSHKEIKAAVTEITVPIASTATLGPR